MEWFQDLNPVHLLLSFVVPLGLWLLLSTRGRQRGRPKLPLPPGPSGLPIIGHILMVEHLSHRGLAKLAEKYGGLFHLQLGFLRTVTVSTPEMARHVLPAQDIVFSNRPNTIASAYLSYDRADMVTAHYGPFWRKLRKLCVVKLFSRRHAESWASARDEVDVAVAQTAAAAGTPVNIGALVSNLTMNITYRAAFGARNHEEQEEFITILEEFSKLFTAINIADFVPWPKWFDVQGLNKRMKTARASLDRYFRRFSSLQVRSRRSGKISHFWRGILRIGQVYKCGTKLVVGNGKQIRFWEDRWAGDLPLGKLFPDLLALARSATASVASQCTRENGGTVWRPQFVSEIPPLLSAQHGELMGILDLISLNSEPDQSRWRWTNSGQFTVNSFYRFLNDGGLVCPMATTLWKIKAPLRFRIFMRLVLLNRVLTRWNLRKRGHPNVPDVSCPLCGHPKETVNHLFLQCPLSADIWSRLRAKLSIGGRPASLKSLWTTWRKKRVPKTIRPSWDLLVLAVCWAIWTERNSRVFKGEVTSADGLLCRTKALLETWGLELQGLASDRLKTLISSAF